jgi:cytochrome oxidase Cu insertion factor (SCO1/SenC/PrrC family)
MNWSKILKVVAMVVIIGAVAFGAFVFVVIQTPKPQIVSASGKTAPLFTLKDQDGKDFALASLHGQHVLIIFYRGYW